MPESPAHPVSYASTFARRTCPGRRVSPAFRILAKGSSRGEQCHAPTGFPLAMPFQTGRFRRLQLKQLSMWRSFLVPRRARPHPKLGGSRQPLDRQVRYYSDWPEEASRLLGDDCCTDGTGVEEAAKIAPRNAKAPLPRGVAPRHCNWSLASRTSGPVAVPPVLLQWAGRSPLRWRLLLPVSAFSAADLISILSACYITGTLLIAIAVPFA
jgi:hypothetical protein